MFEYIEKFYHLLNDYDFFWFCALLGTGMFIIQFISNLLGVADAEIEFENESHEVSDTKRLKWLSLQTVAGFLMMFGWTAITCQKEFHLQIGSTILIAFIAGFSTIFIVNRIFKLAKTLHSSGNVYNIEEALGKEAVVYQRIPIGGMGKISLALQDLTYEINAVSDNQEIPSFTRVQIIKKIDDHTVLVIAI